MEVGTQRNTIHSIRRDKRQVEKVMKPYKKLKLYIFGLVIFALIFVISLMYQRDSALSVVDKSLPVKEQAWQVAPWPETPAENSIDKGETISQLKQEAVVSRKTLMAAAETVTRGNPGVPLPVPATGEAALREEQKEEKQDAGYDTTLNSYVLDVIKTYPLGRYPYLLNNDYANYNGVTTNLYYQGRLLLKAHPSGNRASHCSGITFEVFFKAMQNRNKKLGLDPHDFNGMSYDQLYDFILTWYAADGNKSTRNIAAAVEKYGIGRRITTLENARAGDFVDFSRENNTGHTAVFLNWLKDEKGRIIGIKYWSSQESTKGINYKQEYFNVLDANGRKYGNVMIDKVYIARINPVKEYKKFD